MGHFKRRLEGLSGLVLYNFDKKLCFWIRIKLITTCRRLTDSGYDLAVGRAYIAFLICTHSAEWILV